jgi:RHS repeat-associated protein
MTDSYEYDAFGNSFTKTGTTPNNYLYRGEQYDPDLGLYYLRARYYNPATGRFMSRDPLDGDATDPASLHKYLYAGGDPVNRVDPMGRVATIETIFTTTDISTPTEIGLRLLGSAINTCLENETVSTITLVAAALAFAEPTTTTLGIAITPISACLLEPVFFPKGGAGAGGGGGSGGGGDDPPYGPGTWGPTPPYGPN